jgi:RNA polymerase sigma-70 factor (ECF subfamily)
VTPESPEPVAELVARAAQGERAAEETLCRRFAPVVRAFARRRLRGDAVDEFAQDVLLLMLEGLRERRVEQPERLGGFVLGICRNLAFERARQQERRRALWETYGAALEVVSFEAATREHYRIAQLEDCMSQLSRRAREVLRLGYVEAQSHEQVATVLEISPSNARVLRHRTLDSLRECMSKRLSWELV